MIKRKIIYTITLFFGTFIAYESYAVAVAYNNLFKKFLPYVATTPKKYGLNQERLEILVKIQDPTFYAHSGIEWPSPLTTTTITQSLVKKLFFKTFTKGFKKIEQTLIARFVVTPNISKETQLVAFMSTAYFGEYEGKSLFGFDQGAHFWFNKSLSELSDNEYLALIAMLPAPNIFKPNTAASRERLRRIKLVLDGKCIHEQVSQIYLEQCIENSS